MRWVRARSVVTTIGFVDGGREVTPKEFYEWIRNAIKNESGAKSRDEYMKMFLESRQAKELKVQYKDDDVYTLIDKAVRNAK